MNASAYVQKVEDLQTIVTDAVGVTRNLSIDELQSKGIEVDAVFVPEFIDGLTLTGTFNFNDVEIESFPERPDLEGIRFRDNPRLSYSMIGDYRRDVTADGAKGFLRAEWAWQSSKNTSLDRCPRPSWTNMDCSIYGLGCRTQKTHWHSHSRSRMCLTKTSSILCSRLPTARLMA